MNYIGSKRRLLTQIADLIVSEFGEINGKVLDVFAGTGVVSQWLKSTGCQVVSNDWQQYSVLVTRQALCWDDWPTFSRLAETLPECKVQSTAIQPFSYLPQPISKMPDSLLQVLSYLLELAGSTGLFYEEYCDGGASNRRYFSKENGLRIQAIRDQILSWQHSELISVSESEWLVAVLIESADRVGNTAAVYGSFLKSVKRTALAPLRFYVQAPTVSPANNACMVQCLTADRFIAQNRGNSSLIYADPPYNGRQYAANYHVLETIARWDLGDWVPRGKTGLRPGDQNRSEFCMPKSVQAAFRNLFRNVAGIPLLLSYNNEGLMKESDFRILGEEFYSKCDVLRVPYSRFRSDNPSENRLIQSKNVEEFLILFR